MSSLPELEEFGLIGMAQAERIEGDQRWFSLPQAIIDRLPRIMLKKQFRDTSAPLVTGPTMPFVVDGIFDVRLYAIWAKRWGNLPLESISGIGDLSIVRFCEAALAPLGTDYRGRECKKFLGQIEEFAESKTPKWLLAYLPCLSLLSLCDVNLTDGKSVVTIIRDAATVSVEDRSIVAHELDKMAGLIGIMVSNNLPIFSPDKNTPKVEAVQIKAWATGLLKMAKSFAPEDPLKFYRFAHKNTGAKLLLDAARQLNSVVAESMKIIRRTKDKAATPVEVDRYIESEPGPDCVEVYDEPEQQTEPTHGDSRLIQVVDAVALKADTGLRKVARESWSVERLDQLITGVRAIPLQSSTFEELAAEMPHASKLLLNIAQALQISENYGRPVYTFPRPILIIGAPGVGKTWFCRAIAQACGLPSHTLSLAGVDDSKLVNGSHRSWSAAIPSAPVQLLSSGVYNGLLIIDEVDKARGGRNGDPVASLLPLIERSSAKTFYDQFLCSTVDVSGTNYVLTSNSARLPAPLLSRCDVFHLRAPEPEQFPALVASIRREFGDEIGLDHRFLPVITMADIEFLQEHCVGDIRALAAATRRMLQCRSAEAHSGVLN